MIKEVKGEIVIKKEKTKAIAAIFVSCFLIPIGIGLWSDLEKFYPVNPEHVRIAAFTILSFGGALCIYGLNRALDTNPGLVMDKNGIFDRSNFASGHLIKWRDIKLIEIKLIGKEKLVLIHVYNPQEYIGKANPINRYFLKSNEKTYGTPFRISVLSLKCGPDELYDKLTEIMAGRGLKA
ncbi:hypothetical protein JXL83_06330 [candidate division WOR-3 bacterium]|nr:hypothetical protein [candidate division WOR-3 bacterium]